MSSESEKSRYNFQCDAQLLEDAKRKAEYGELAEKGRQMLRRIAYGGDEESDDLSRSRAELEAVRDRLDDLRRRRRDLDAEIETVEDRAVRLEERVHRLEQEREDRQASMETLENMLHNGTRLWPTRIKNAITDVETEDEARRLYGELRDEYPDLPPTAFEEPGVHEPADWRDVGGDPQ